MHATFYTYFLWYVVCGRGMRYGGSYMYNVVWYSVVHGMVCWAIFSRPLFTCIAVIRIKLST